MAAMLLRDADLLIPLALVWTAALGAAYLLLQSAPAGLFGALQLPATLLAEAFFVGAAAYAAVGAYTPRLTEALDVGGRAYLTLLPALLIINLAVAVGLAFLILPGLAAMTLLVMTVPVVMAERPPLRAAFERSGSLAFPVFWPALACIVIVGIPLLIALGIVAAFGAGGTLLAAAADAVSEAVAGIVWTYLGAALYFELAGDTQRGVVDTFD